MRIRNNRDPKYDSARWHRLRVQQLQLQPLCELCKARGQIIPAEVVHHVVPHRGNAFLFFTGKLQSFCKECHDGTIQKIEKAGFNDEIGADGWPTDPKHPSNKGRK